MEMRGFSEMGQQGLGGRIPKRESRGLGKGNGRESVDGNSHYFIDRVTLGLLQSTQNTAPGAWHRANTCDCWLSLLLLVLVSVLFYLLSVPLRLSSIVLLYYYTAGQGKPLRD